MRFLSVQTCKVCVDPAFQGKSAIWFCKNFFIQGDCQVSNNGFDCFCMWHSELSYEPSNLTLCKCNARTSDIWCVQQHLNCTFAISCLLIPQFYSSGLDPSSAAHGSGVPLDFHPVLILVVTMIVSIKPFWVMFFYPQGQSATPIPRHSVKSPSIFRPNSSVLSCLTKPQHPFDQEQKQC